ncbi:unnamed protein product [Durusdinium trenchii]|uniref:Uncharacterized protein n=1 Tax=Durusdinium trenchii TaxID=1381693 RepID=A0ABP0M2U3_9DINO
MAGAGVASAGVGAASAASAGRLPSPGKAPPSTPGQEVLELPESPELALQTAGRIAPLPAEEAAEATQFRFALEQDDPYERFIKQQLALLDDDLRKLQLEEPLVQEQLKALEAQLRSRKPPSAQDSGTAGPTPRGPRRLGQMSPKQMSPRAAAANRRTEGEARSLALERRVQQLIERREQREKSQKVTPPASQTATPRTQRDVLGRSQHSGSPVPGRTGAVFVPLEGQMYLEGPQSVLHGPESARFHLDPASAVLTARHWSPGHWRPEVSRFDLDPVTNREWPVVGTHVPEPHVRPHLPGQLPAAPQESSRPHRRKERSQGPSRSRKGRSKERSRERSTASKEHRDSPDRSEMQRSVASKEKKQREEDRTEDAPRERLAERIARAEQLVGGREELLRRFSAGDSHAGGRRNRGDGQQGAKRDT